MTICINISPENLHQAAILGSKETPFATKR